MTRGLRTHIPTGPARARETTEGQENIIEILLKMLTDPERRFYPAAEPVMRQADDTALAQELRQLVKAITA